MLKHGNSNPGVCVINLLRTWRGEVPYERLKGVDPTPYDRPQGIARPALEADALWVISTYEPRVNARDAVTTALSSEGDYDMLIDLENNE